MTDLSELQCTDRCLKEASRKPTYLATGIHGWPSVPHIPASPQDTMTDTAILVGQGRLARRGNRGTVLCCCYTGSPTTESRTRPPAALHLRSRVQEGWEGAS